MKQLKPKRQGSKKARPVARKVASRKAPDPYKPGMANIEREAKGAFQRLLGNMESEKLKELMNDPIFVRDIEAKAHAQAKSDAFSQPEYQAAAVEIQFGESVVPGMELNRLRHNLEEANARIFNGDMRDVEAMLYSQARTLNVVFTSLARRAAGQDFLNQYQTFMTLALKAQSQSRATLEALAYVKNPPSATFVRQQNVAANQQVNNHTTGARTEPTGNQSNKLLEVTHNQPQRLDLGTATSASMQDQPVEAVGAVNRPADSPRQAGVQQER